MGNSALFFVTSKTNDLRKSLRTSPDSLWYNNGSSQEKEISRRSMPRENSSNDANSRWQFCRLCIYNRYPYYHTICPLTDCQIVRLSNKKINHYWREWRQRTSIILILAPAFVAIISGGYSAGCGMTASHRRNESNRKQILKSFKNHGLHCQNNFKHASSATIEL